MGNDSRAIVVPTSSGYKTVETNCPINEPPADLSAVKNKTLREVLISSLVMGCVALSWALSTQFSKSALNLDKAHFYAPYSLVWFSTNFMTTCYPVYMVYIITTKGMSREAIRTAHEEAGKVYGRRGPLLKSYIKRTALFLFFWTGANYSYSQSLGHISASATASIMSSNAAMVCTLGWIILKDQFIPFRLVSIVAAIGGVVIMSLDKEFAGSVLGICLSIFSAFMAACYKVLFKKVIGDATLGQVSMFMSGLGCMNLFINIIPATILVLTNAETVDWTYIPWLPLIGSALLNLMFNFLINFGIALLHPLVISVGMLFGIPISTAIDIIFRGMRATTFFIIGTVLILFSCAIIALPAHLFKGMFSPCRSRISAKETVIPEQVSVGRF
uniref:EamA domain-containing protein n=1 Tax=Parascaris univalens TaxID=6257 RepID=A0A914ZSZ4_PARUN